jgi:hypothetical protein
MCQSIASKIRKVQAYSSHKICKFKEMKLHFIKKVYIDYSYGTFRGNLSGKGFDWVKFLQLHVPIIA